MAMIETYSAYVVATGHFTGKRITCAPVLLPLNTLPGEAWVAGEIDAARFLVESVVVDDFGVQAPILAQYQPSAPAATEWCTWAWDEVAWRWVEVPTLALLKSRASEPLLQQLAQLDAKVARPAGEIAEALGLGQPVPEAAVQRLQSINLEKAGLRQQLAAIAAWTSPPE